ncbi:MAG: DUF3987 domain-containing protein [Acidimicrobiales bacterium]
MSAAEHLPPEAAGAIGEALNAEGTSPVWPTLPPAALHGLAGEFVAAASPHTEADPAAMLASVLAGYGVAVGRTPHALAGNARHPASLFVVIVGPTSKAGKGTSWAATEATLIGAAPGIQARILGGFGSGEAVVDEVRDPDDDDAPASRDPRLLIHEGEFAKILKVCAREGSTLSSIIRDGWDGRPLATRSRSRKVVASSHHLGVVGHVTAEELRARLTDTETYGGFTNRFLFVCAKRARLLPAGGNVPADVIDAYAARFGDAILLARGMGRLERTDAAAARWADIYQEMADDEPGGLLGAIIARDAPQTLRLSLIYALLDGAEAIDVEHVNAAYALWTYCRASAGYIFGDRLGDEVAEKLLAAISEHGAEGLDGTGQRDALGRHQTGRRLEVARDLLERRGLIVTTSEATEGRPRLVSRPCPGQPPGTCDQSDRSDRRSLPDPLSSPRSLRSHPQEDDWQEVDGHEEVGS